MVMIRFTRTRLPFLVLAMYTALFVVGVFSFAAAEQLRAVNRGMENAASGRISGVGERYVFPCPAGEPVIIAKIDDASFTPPRAGFQRISFLSLPPCAGSVWSEPSFRAHTGISPVNFKNSILLKLRI
jgi:hypothetical protein